MTGGDTVQAPRQTDIKAPGMTARELVGAIVTRVRHQRLIEDGPCPKALRFKYVG